MKTKPSVTAQKLLNLYRQQHVIFSGWAAVNAVLVAEADANVLAELKELPNGARLIQHIENLRSGKTPMNSINQDLLPYGGLMTEFSGAGSLSESEISELENALSNFTPDSDGLDRIQSLKVVQQFGSEWASSVRSALLGNLELSNKWNAVFKTARAYQLWDTANEILAAPLSDRTRAQIQADLPEFETYLPMFGDAGTDILSKLRVFVSTI